MSNDLSEYMTILRFDEDEMSSKFNLLTGAMIANSWELLDLDILESEFDKCIAYFRLCKRFRAMDKLLDGELSITDDGFEIDEHLFQTLDEVQKAVDNKAFL
jgi:hypothetical protein